jgi:hypothetical protein
MEYILNMPNFIVIKRAKLTNLSSVAHTILESHNFDEILRRRLPIVQY